MPAIKKHLLIVDFLTGGVSFRVYFLGFSSSRYGRCFAWQRKVYLPELKLEAIRLKLEEGLLYREIAERLEISSPDMVKFWMRTYRKEGPGGLRKTRGRPKEDKDSLEVRIKQLEMENTLLKALAIELGEELPEGLDIEPYPDIEGNSK